MDPTAKTKVLSEEERKAREVAIGYSKVVEEFDDVRGINSAKFLGSEGEVIDLRHIVVLRKCYFQRNAPGDVCGLKPKDAQMLVENGNASYWLSKDQVFEKEKKEREAREVNKKVTSTSFRNRK